MAEARSLQPKLKHRLRASTGETERGWRGDVTCWDQLTAGDQLSPLRPLKECQDFTATIGEEQKKNTKKPNKKKHRGAAKGGEGRSTSQALLKLKCRSLRQPSNITLVGKDK